jgi:cephalosporin-C deacetylase-like acetyl esterase
MRKKGIKKFTVKLPEITNPGVYNIDAALNVSTYDDTTKHAFGYRVNQITTPYHLPPDFDEFWKTARTELAGIDPQYRIIPDEGKSTYFHTVYRVEFQSLGNVPVFGWLSIPKPRGKYPVLVGFGGYKIELNPLYFDDFISFTVNVRGIDKKVKEMINPENREQLLVNIENKEDYIYRGIYMDCIRAIEFIYAHADMGMDLKRVIAFGGSQGASLSLVTAAMMPDKINTVVANNPIFFDWVRHVEITESNPNVQFPIRDMRRFQEKNPEMTIDRMVHTLQYFEVQNFMPAVACPVLYAVSLLDEFVPPGTALAAYNKMSPETIAKSEIYVFPKLGHEVPRSHDAFVSKWFLEKVVKKRKFVKNEFGNQ